MVSAQDDRDAPPQFTDGVQWRLLLILAAVLAT